MFRRREGAVEIFFIKDPYQRWAFPKGKHTSGETYIQTAIREIREETGLERLKYVAPLGKTSFRFRREEGVIHKIVFFFLFQAQPDAKEKLMTREEYQVGKEPIFEAKWVPLEEAFSCSGYKNSDHLIAQAFRIIGKQGGSGK